MGRRGKTNTKATHKWIDPHEASAATSTVNSCIFRTDFLNQNQVLALPNRSQHAPHAPVSQGVHTLRARNLLAASRAGEGLLRVADVLDALGVEVVAASKPPRFLVVHLKAHGAVLCAIAFVRCRSTGSVALLALGSLAAVLADRSTAALLALST